MEMKDCPDCAGTGKVENPEWEKEWDRLDDTGVFTMDDINKKVSRYKRCPKCGGTGKIPAEK